MTVLVTGATGGFGRLVRQWLRQQTGETIVATGRSQQVADDYIACDFTDANAISALVCRTRPTRVFHLAGSFSGDYQTDYQINALSARHLLEALLHNKIAARAVFIGSAAEYGIVSPGENPITEDHVLRPVSIYGVTKAFQTHFASYYANAVGADVVVARLFNLMAPGLSERLFVGRMEKLIDQHRRKEIDHIEVGNLGSQRDYVQAQEAIQQLQLIAERGRAGEIYHVANGVPTVMRDVLKTMLAAAGLDMSVVREGQMAAIDRVGYDVPIIYADMRKTRALQSVGITGEARR